MAAVELPGGILSITQETADKLFGLGQGDCALLYLSLLRQGGDLGRAAAALSWSQGRVNAAYTPLQSVGLVGPAPLSPESRAEAAPIPEYVTQDIVSALEGDAAFAALQKQVEKLLGSILSTADLKQLYLIYDYLALPAEVIQVLVIWCVSEMERKYGPGRRPRMSQIKKAAFRWRDEGIDTLSAVDVYLKRQSGLHDRERSLLPLVGIRDRTPVDKEREYLATWVDWGFSDDAISLAYQKTLLKKQSMSWPYMNSILKSWHTKGLHTVQTIEAAEAAPRQTVPAPQEGQSAAQELARLRKAMKKEGQP